jgi:uncharacterized membrane protein (UPF0127 family)
MRVSVLVLLAACWGRDAAQPAPTWAITFETERGDAVIRAEVAATRDRIARGLAHREALDPDRGMWFVMRREKVWSFWMKDTKLPLDIIFVTRDLEVAGVVENAEPLDGRRLEVKARSSYVLEVNAGWATAHGVTRGTRVRVEP